MGLPPQVRGALAVRLVIESLTGLTPAGAGSTLVSSNRTASSRAYPRRCGEHFTVLDGFVECAGLPPQVRGAPQSPPAGIPAGGLTPAGAGSTSGFLGWLTRRRAYPRRCGEHASLGARSDITLGLPPQVRGARVPTRWDRVAAGLTPAGAGSTSGRRLGSR